MADLKQKFYVTTPIYYVNARPHIGHAYTTIVADVLARRHRLLGDDTFFLTGTDEHGQKIERSAAAAGIPPQQFADEVSAAFRTLWKRMGITYDDYIRTTEPRHAVGAQQLFTTLYDRGFIYLDTYTGAYCVSDEAFIDVQAGEPCPECGRITEIVTEENFFFKLSAFQLPLLNLIESGELKIENEARRNEVLSFVRGGLKDLSVSRSSFTWGIPVPESVQKSAGAKQKHVIYVWLDALTNYMTAIGYGADTDAALTEEQRADAKAKFEKYWPADLHLVGKEIIRFHCVYWPAFLLAANLPLPKAITAHGWLLFDNSKMSKSKGNIVRTETILDAFGEHVYGKQFPDSTKAERDLFASDVLRYFLLREIPFGQDGTFSFEALHTRYNADLANSYGNLVSRTLKMIQDYFPDGYEKPSAPWLCPDRNVFREDNEPASLKEAFSGTHFIREDAIQTAAFAEKDLWPTNKFQLILAQLQQHIGYVDGYLSFHTPWKLAKSTDIQDRKKLVEVLYTAADSIRLLTAMLHPFLPFSTSQVWQQLGLGDIEVAAHNGELTNLRCAGLQSGTKLGPLAPIFPRADKGTIDIMTDSENNAAAQTTAASPAAARLAAPLASSTMPTPAVPVPSESTHPGAPPRSFTGDAAATTVAGSAATTTRTGLTPPHTEATPSAPFNAPAAQATSSPEANTEASPQITIDDFAKVELRIAQVLVAERIPKADKLLRIEVDLGLNAAGEPEKRQILSGIAEHYTPEELVGKRIIVITNLAPRKMRGLESHGMLLAASEEGGKPYLATVPEGVPIGTRLK
jgi:methionyl-tRNA synthetase